MLDGEDWEIEEPFEDEPERADREGLGGVEPATASIGAALVTLIICAPVAWMAWTMRTNIGTQLDGDLRWILIKFCDTVLMFCIFFPVCSAIPHPAFQALARRVLKGVLKLVTVAKWTAIAAFVAAALAAFAYLGWELWKLIF